MDYFGELFLNILWLFLKVKIQNLLFFYFFFFLGGGLLTFNIFFIGGGGACLILLIFWGVNSRCLVQVFVAR